MTTKLIVNFIAYVQWIFQSFYDLFSAVKSGLYVSFMQYIFICIINA